VAGDFRLISPDGRDEESDTDLIKGHQAQQTQARPVGQRLEEPFHIEFLGVFSHNEIFSENLSNTS
jgi:hypothetical protein